MTRRQVLARREAAGEAERRVGAAAAARPRPDREGHTMATARAAALDVAPAQPPRVARGQLEEPDPRRRHASALAAAAERRRERVVRSALRAAGEERPRHPARANRQPALGGSTRDLLPPEREAARAAGRGRRQRRYVLTSPGPDLRAPALASTVARQLLCALRTSLLSMM